MKTHKLIGLAMLALLSACATGGDSTNEPHASESGPAGSEPAEHAAAQPVVAENVDSEIPQVSRSQVIDLQRASEMLPMPSVATATSHTVAYDAITGGHQSARAVDLCELAYLYDGGAGRYRVRDIVSVAESIRINGGSSTAAFTYIQLELEQDWSGFAPRNPVVRIRGGALNDELSQTWDVGVKRNEVIGLFLSSPLKDQNKGYYRIESLGVFREKADGGYSNGQLFEHKVASLDELGKLTHELYDALPQVIHLPPWRRLAVPRDRCVQNVMPDAHDHAFDLDALRSKQPKIEEVQLEHSSVQ